MKGKRMKHLTTVSKSMDRPVEASNSLEKMVSFQSLLALVVAGQEASDLLLKADTHDNG
jgi:hypothetical protein